MVKFHCSYILGEKKHISAIIPRGTWESCRARLREELARGADARDRAHGDEHVEDGPRDARQDVEHRWCPAQWGCVVKAKGGVEQARSLLRTEKGGNSTRREMKGKCCDEHVEDGPRNAGQDVEHRWCPAQW